MNPWAILGLVAAWAASVAAVGVWQHNVGAAIEKAVWVEKENAEVKAANEKIDALQKAAREKERQYVVGVATITSKLVKEKADALAKQVTLEDALNRGVVELRDPGAKSSCSSGAAQATAGAGRSDGGSGARLSTEAASFLLRLTGEADDVTRQLGACQAVIKEDRK